MVEKTKKSWEEILLRPLNFIIGIILIWLIVLTVIIVEEEKRLNTLYQTIGTGNGIKATNTSSRLYSYHTRNTSYILKSYSGYYLITYSPNASVNFTVTNQNGKDITGNITNPEYSNLPTKIEFNSPSPTELVTLNYTSISDFNLERLEIMI